MIDNKINISSISVWIKFGDDDDDDDDDW